MDEANGVSAAIAVGMVELQERKERLEKELASVTEQLLMQKGAWKVSQHLASFAQEQAAAEAETEEEPAVETEAE